MWVDVALGYRLRPSFDLKVFTCRGCSAPFQPVRWLNDLRGIFAEELRWVDEVVRVVAAAALHHDRRGEIDPDTGGVVEDGDGFGVDLPVDAEDRGVRVEGGFSALSVVVEGVDAGGIGAEELLVDLYTEL